MKLKKHKPKPSKQKMDKIKNGGVEVRREEIRMREWNTGKRLLAFGVEDKRSRLFRTRHVWSFAIGSFSLFLLKTYGRCDHEEGSTRKAEYSTFRSTARR